MATAAEIVLIKISELAEMLSTDFNGSYIPLSKGLDSYRLELEQLRLDILNNAVLTGAPTAPTPNPGDDSQKVATTEYVQDELSSLGLNPATDTTYGTVYMYSPGNPTPTVYSIEQVYRRDETYSRAEVDAIAAAVKPVNQGGTGATTAADARANLVAAKSGANTDITSLDVVAIGDGSIATTQPANANNTKLATTAYADRAVRNAYTFGAVQSSAVVVTSVNAWTGWVGGNFVQRFNNEGCTLNTSNGTTTIPAAGTFKVTISTSYFTNTGTVTAVAIGVSVGGSLVGFAQVQGTAGNLTGTLIIQRTAPGAFNMQPIIFVSGTSPVSGQITQCHMIIERISF